MTYLGAAPTTTASRKSQVTYRYLCTAGQSVISGADLNNNTLSCDPLDTEIFMNGLKLDSTDTTITATQVTLAVPAAAGDEIEVVAYRTFESADHYDKSTSDTRYVNASGDTMTGNLGVGGAANGTYAITSHSSGGANLRLENDGEVGFIRLEDDGDLNIWAHGDENISFLTGTGSGTTRMNIDGSGRVTTPYQPSWHGTHADNYGSAYSAGTAHNMTSSLERYNVGNHFDYTNNRFTCPVAGYYLVYGWDICLNSSSIYNTGNAIGCWKNTFSGANRLVSAYRMYGRGYSFTGTAYLAANDYVTFGNTESSIGAGAYYGSLGYSGYGIRLLA